MFSQINVGKYYVRIITAFNKPSSIEELKKGRYIYSSYVGSIECYYHQIYKKLVIEDCLWGIFFIIRSPIIWNFLELWNRKIKRLPSQGSCLKFICVYLIVLIWTRHACRGTEDQCKSHYTFHIELGSTSSTLALKQVIEKNRKQQSINIKTYVLVQFIYSDYL